MLGPEIDRQQAEGKQVAFRSDAAFRQARDLRGVGATRRLVRDRIPANRTLELAIEPLLSAARPSESQTPDSLRELRIPGRRLNAPSTRYH